MNQRAKQILQKADVDKLPSLPHVLLQLLDICHDESLSYSDLANILRQDPGLYARIYSISQRSHGAHHSKPKDSVQTFERILEHLGINTIKSIAVTATVQQFFSRINLERTDFLKQHWHHSLYCANVAESIAQLYHYNNPDEAYTAGLLHDIGQLVFESSYPEKYTATFAQLSEDDNFHTLELDEFGATHQQVGAELLKKHGANNFICDAVLYHHEKVEYIVDAHPLVKIVNLANLLTSSHFKAEDQLVFDGALELLGLHKPLLLEILEQAQQRVKTTASAFGISLTKDGINGEVVKQHKADDELKQDQLAEQVRNIALLDGIHQYLSRSEGQDALLHIVSQHLDILFGVKQCLLFLYQQQNDKVHAISHNHQPQQLADIAIPLMANRSLVTDALLNKQANHSFDKSKTLSIIDRQLVGLTEQQGIICLPMMMDNVTIGTLLLGVDKTQHESLWKQLPLLMRFVNEVTHTICAKRATLFPMTDAEQDSQQQKIREVLHEVRNPLSIMNNYLGILSHRLDGDKPAQADVRTIKSEIERVSLILNRLTEPESAADETTPVDINAILTNLTHIFQTSLFANKNIDATLELDKRINTLQSNANAIKQIYTNLINNAVEALPTNGKLMVYTHDYVNVNGKEHIELVVTDNGPGVETYILSRLFTPVDSTKGENHAGLGLTIVKNLVTELHGSISCRSNDKGTSFHVILPK